jgi:hypothetical protein
MTESFEYTSRSMAQSARSRSRRSQLPASERSARNSPRSSKTSTSSNSAIVRARAQVPGVPQKTRCASGKRARRRAIAERAMAIEPIPWNLSTTTERTGNAA